MGLLYTIEKMKHEFLKRFGSNYQPMYVYYERGFSAKDLNIELDQKSFYDAINKIPMKYFGMIIKNKPSFFNAICFDENPIVIWHVEKDLDDHKEGFVSLHTGIRYIRCTEKGEIIV